MNATPQPRAISIEETRDLNELFLAIRSHVGSHQVAVGVIEGIRSFRPPEERALVRYELVPWVNPISGGDTSGLHWDLRAVLDNGDVVSRVQWSAVKREAHG